jgi:hypothetical protein
MHLNDTIREMIYTAFADIDQQRKQAPQLATGLTTGVRVGNPAVLDQAASGSLCHSCLKRADCSRPGRSGGVWHCEEYF